MKGAQTMFEKNTQICSFPECESPRFKKKENNRKHTEKIGNKMESWYKRGLPHFTYQCLK